MIARAKQNLDSYSQKLAFSICDNNALTSIRKRADFVIEGWSFGHTITNKKRDVGLIADYFVESTKRLLVPGAPVIIIETLGTNTDLPKPPDKKEAFALL